MEQTLDELLNLIDGNTVKIEGYKVKFDYDLVFNVNTSKEHGKGVYANLDGEEEYGMKTFDLLYHLTPDMDGSKVLNQMDTKKVIDDILDSTIELIEEKDKHHLEEVKDFFGNKEYQDRLEVTKLLNYSAIGKSRIISNEVF